MLHCYAKHGRLWHSVMAFHYSACTFGQTISFCPFQQRWELFPLEQDIPAERSTALLDQLYLTSCGSTHSTACQSKRGAALSLLIRPEDTITSDLLNRIFQQHCRSNKTRGSSLSQKVSHTARNIVYCHYLKPWSLSRSSWLFCGLGLGLLGQLPIQVSPSPMVPATMAQTLEPAGGTSLLILIITNIFRTLGSRGNTGLWSKMSQWRLT